MSCMLGQLQTRTCLCFAGAVTDFLHPCQAHGLPYMQLTWEVETLPYAHAASFNGQVTLMLSLYVRHACGVLFDFAGHTHWSRHRRLVPCRLLPVSRHPCTGLASNACHATGCLTWVNLCSVSCVLNKLLSNNLQGSLLASADQTPAPDTIKCFFTAHCQCSSLGYGVGAKALPARIPGT